MVCNDISGGRQETLSTRTCCSCVDFTKDQISLYLPFCLLKLLFWKTVFLDLLLKYCKVLLQASGSVFRRLHKRSASHGEELTSGGALSGSGSGAAGLPSAKKASQKAVIKQKKLLFVHFAINRVHCRVTYKVSSCFSCRMQTSRIWTGCPVLVCMLTCSLLC